MMGLLKNNKTSKLFSYLEIQKFRSEETLDSQLLYIFITSDLLDLMGTR